MTIAIRYKTQLGDGKHLYGAYCTGIHELLLHVRETGSLYAAARQLNMAYSKAWRIMRACEDVNNITLLERMGARGSRLTETAELWMTTFEYAAKGDYHAA